MIYACPNNSIGIDNPTTDEMTGEMTGETTGVCNTPLQPNRYEQIVAIGKTVGDDVHIVPQNIAPNLNLQKTKHHRFARRNPN